MANNRIYLRCQACGKEFFLGKRFGSGYYYDNYSPESGDLEEQLNDFYDAHAFCGDADGLDCFEMVYDEERDWMPASKGVDANYGESQKIRSGTHD